MKSVFRAPGGRSEKKGGKWQLVSEARKPRGTRGKGVKSLPRPGSQVLS